MNETLISRPTFYEALGVDPAATVAEIEQAFARRISMFTPSAFGNVTQFGIAYQTLRDPIRREQYDRSIGVEPRPRQGLPSLQPGQVMFIAAQHREPANRLLAEQVIVEPPKAVEPPPPAPLPRGPATTDQIQTELLYRDILARRAAPAQAADGSVDWKRTGIAVGGLIVAVAALGAWAGSQAGSDVEAKNLEAVSVPLPPAEADGATTPSVLNVPDDIMQPPQTSAQGRRYAVVRRTPATRRPDPLKTVPETPPADAAPVAGEVSNSGAANPPPVTDLPAAMPLSNQTVARTLHRIGYSCGSVDSTSASGGGTFRVNCSSGHSYQATPVRGRYRFRRI